MTMFINWVWVYFYSQHLSVYLMTMLNLPDSTLKFYSTAMFVIVNT
jgi:hypothetical protein